MRERNKEKEKKEGKKGKGWSYNLILWLVK